MKKSLIVLLIILGQMPLFAQRNPYNEILVYFNTGVSQETRMISGQLKKIANLYSESLKENLAKIGIEESMIEVAMPNFIQADTIKTFQDGTKLRQPDMTKLFRVTPHSKKDIIQTIGKLSELPQVGYAHQNGKVASCLTPNDEYFEEQWNLYNPITPGADIHTLGAWDTYTGNLNNIIGIIDWGVDGDHEDLNAKISGGDTGYSIDDPNHGTHVAGIAAAESNNNQGISGVDWNARIHSKRVDICLDDADLYESIIAAINYSSNVKVINNSWECIYEDRSPGRYSYTIGLAFAAIYNANRTPVAAMGNR